MWSSLSAESFATISFSFLACAIRLPVPPVAEDVDDVCCSDAASFEPGEALSAERHSRTRATEK